ncbi:hypothetical protein D7Y27_16700 [Corallococcus sp. AB004]|nr:hypothetical protein D7Y27_16700 [Corallococcus sp. AB004]
MLRSLALTCTAALALVCAACGGDSEDAVPFEQPQDTRSSVTGEHPATLIFNTQVNGGADAFQTLLVLSPAVGSRDDLHVSLPPFECDLTATMTGEATFALQPGSCSLYIPPQNQQFACNIDLAILRGTGGRDTGGEWVGLEFTARYRRMCAGDAQPSLATVIATVVKT